MLAYYNNIDIMLSECHNDHELGDIYVSMWVIPCQLTEWSPQRSTPSDLLANSQLDRLLLKMENLKI